jgi:bifunctional non-homologous end joining protein LigD
LEGLLQKNGECVRYSPGMEASPSALLSLIATHGLEGIIGKKKLSRYEPGLRSGAWVKYKSVNEQEFVIGGYTPPEGARSFFGALLVGYYRDGQLTFASKVGTGFSHKTLKSLHSQFQKIKIDHCPFVNLPAKGGGQGMSRAEVRRCTWVEPKYVCQVHFTEWTREGGLRHPAFIGLREDKNPSEVVRERPENG